MADDDSKRFVVRCRGLPWSTTVDEITNFFSDCTFVEGNDNVHLTLTREGRPSGEAYIEVASEEDVEKALEKDKQHMGKRYVEGTNPCFIQHFFICIGAGGGAGYMIAVCTGEGHGKKRSVTMFSYNHFFVPPAPNITFLFVPGQQ
jgi:RNA recognition motif-containing protein